MASISALVRIWMVGGGLSLGLLVLSAPSLFANESEAQTPLAFFDPVISISPGISREVDAVVDHFRSSDGRLTLLSLRLQYPVQSWLQFSLEIPVVLQDPDGGSASTGPGDIILQGQAAAWTPKGWPAELDLGLELTLPSGGSSVLAGSTAVRPFLAAGVKFGPLDVIGNLSYQWVVAGPVARVELFQTTLSIGYTTRWIAPFAELVLLKPVRGLDELTPQVSLVPGIELFLPWNASLSVGVQLPVGAARAFDQRVLAFFKLPF